MKKKDKLILLVESIWIWFCIGLAWSYLYNDLTMKEMIFVTIFGIIIWCIVIVSNVICDKERNKREGIMSD